MAVATESAAELFETRARRAELLVEERTSSSALRSGETTERTRRPLPTADPLSFAAALCRGQGALAERLQSLHTVHSLSGRFGEDVERLLPAVAPLLRAVAEHSPEPLASAARTRLEEAEEVARGRLASSWSGESNTRDDYLSRALLRPYAEVLRIARIVPDRLHTEGHCPFCGGAAIVASRAESREGDGVVRHLHCALCGNAWIALRIRCPACGETSPQKLPLFRTDAHPAAAIEACDGCRSCLKSIDLTRDPRAIPEIDDLASIALDLWAAGEGYTRVEPGLAGV